VVAGGGLEPPTVRYAGAGQGWKLNVFGY